MLGENYKIVTDDKKIAAYCSASASNLNLKPKNRTQ